MAEKIRPLATQRALVFVPLLPLAALILAFAAGHKQYLGEQGIGFMTGMFAVFNWGFFALAILGSRSRYPALVPIACSTIGMVVANLYLILFMFLAEPDPRDSEGVGTFIVLVNSWVVPLFGMIGYWVGTVIKRLRVHISN